MRFKQSIDLLSDANFKSFMDKLEEHEKAVSHFSLNPALAFILQENKVLENEKTG